jgi:hypothetical protein
MNQAILEARADLEAAGLVVRPSGEDGLWIAASTRDVGDGILLSQDACVLLHQGERWVAIFPGPGMLNYEVPGELCDLLPLVRSVYTRYRLLGGPFKEAFPGSVVDPEPYLVGRFPAEDRPHPGPPSRRVAIGDDEGLRIENRHSPPAEEAPEQPADLDEREPR